MRLPRTALGSVLWAVTAAALGCNAIFGIQSGQQASGGATTTTATTATASSGTGGVGTTATTTGTGGGSACQPDRSPPCNADGGVCTPEVLDGTQSSALHLLVSGDYI